MDLLEIIKSRRSIRRYKSDTISKEIILVLKEALLWAPSAGNLQSRHFYFVTRNEIKEKIVEATNGQGFIKQAPLIIVACANPELSATEYGDRGQNLYCINDVSTSIQNLMLLAHEKGIGTCWVGSVDEDMMRKVLSIPNNLKPIAVIPVGYPEDIPDSRERVTIGEAITEIS